MKTLYSIVACQCICASCGCRRPRGTPKVGLSCILVIPLVHSHSAAQSMSSTPYYCDCERYCNGKRNRVSKTTFYSHKKMADPLRRFSATMQTFLNDKPVVVSAPSSSASTSQRPRKRGNDGVTNCTVGNLDINSLSCRER